MHSRKLLLLLITAFALVVPQAAFASSHREALAVLNEPCADNTTRSHG